ncbi:NEP1-interacting 1-like [Olea europaea subsp. europaea]|uniref:NEP1-interacting 1-like n=1 Tax=Olea europaea subsp. europaea TaxID=158383 RepID=A0A8S0S490_OLEEU|nr:NEP1-interacting 1-like [Olea europaea subsp. europaea]
MRPIGINSSSSSELGLPLVLFNSRRQMGAAETTTFEEVQNIFDKGGAKGLARDIVENTPKITIGKKVNVDASGESLFSNLISSIIDHE